MIDDILKQLKDPSHQYRGVPFWSWNDALDPEELRRQVHDMAQAGFGGAFIHARAGLKTEYFGPEWMECIAACVDEGSKVGVDAWLYDEDGYPSGFAGGVVPARGLEYQQKFLRFEVIKVSELKTTKATLACYRSGTGERMDPAALHGDERVLHAWYDVNPYYVDLLDEKVVRAFIDSTYEPYYERFKEHFGREIPGVFTDEPQYGRAGLPWSFTLPEAFRERCGYDILDCLPSLYGQTPDCARHRYDFFSTVAALFESAYSKQLAAWCENHGAKLTGHVLLEENTRFQALCSGNAMAFYRHMHIPGIDWLGRNLGNPVIVKQVASVAAQMGRKLVLSEMFAAAGWNTTLPQLKRIAEWQCALGINLICAHLYPYSIAGVRKKDHPPVIGYQSNWWKHYRAFNDRFARLGQLMAGEAGEQLLIVHPLRSGWIAMDADCTQFSASDESARIDSSFERLSTLLSSAHIDYHYGDETMLAELGSVRDGALRLGQVSYPTAMIPVATTLEPSTVKLLNAFADAGGALYAFDDFPTMLNGVPSDELTKLKARCRIVGLDIDSLQQALRGAPCSAVSVTDGDGSEIQPILHRWCRIDGGTALFLVNLDPEQTYDAHVRLMGYGAAQVLDLDDCTAAAATADANGAATLRLAPGQSCTLVFATAPAAAAVPAAIRRSVALTQDWHITPQSPNALVLDYCRLSIQGGVWSAPAPIVQVQKQLLSMGRTVPVALAFDVESACAFAPEQPLSLVVEHAAEYAVQINGEPVPVRPTRWWKDPSFGVLDISGRIRQGCSTIILSTQFRNSQRVMDKLERAKVFEAEMNMLSYDFELENVYLLGDFAVRSAAAARDAEHDALLQAGPWTLDKRSAQSGAQLTAAGYPFFAGNALLEQDVVLGDLACGRAVLRMDVPHAACARLRVNGQDVRDMLWAPWEADVTAYVRPGRNTIAVELVSTDRNIFGPHHHPRGELVALGPFQFTDVEGWWDDYSLVRFGVGEVRIDIE